MLQARAWDHGFNPPPRRSPIASKRFVEWFLGLRASLSTVGSSTGAQLAMARDSVDGSLFIRDDSAAYAAFSRAEDRHAKFALGALVWGSLGDEEQAILELKSVPARPPITLRCERKLAELADGDGSTVIDLCRDPETDDLTGWAVVEVVEAVTLNNAEIASRLGIPESRVRSRVQSAYRKIGQHPALRALADQA